MCKECILEAVTRSATDMPTASRCGIARKQSGRNVRLPIVAALVTELNGGVRASQHSST